MISWIVSFVYIEEPTRQTLPPPLPFAFSPCLSYCHSRPHPPLSANHNNLPHLKRGTRLLLQARPHPTNSLQAHSHNNSLHLISIRLSPPKHPQTAPPPPCPPPPTPPTHHRHHHRPLTHPSTPPSPPHPPDHQPHPQTPTNAPRTPSRSRSSSPPRSSSPSHRANSTSTPSPSPAAGSSARTTSRRNARGSASWAT